MLESQRGSKTRMIAIACFGVVAVNENGKMEMCSLELDLSSTSVRRFLCNPKRSKKYRKGLWVDALPGRVRHPGAGAPAKNPAFIWFEYNADDVYSIQVATSIAESPN